MNIVFICGSLESGRDGVGDYVRCLSIELLNRNHTVSVIALYDPYISTVTIEEQSVNGVALPVLRIPKIQANNVRITEAQKWVADNRPNLVSIQFVPYSFHDKGLPLFFHKTIQTIQGNAKVQIMFHELWLDEAKGIKEKIVKFLQKKIIRRFVKQLSPQIIHTTIPYNQQRLLMCQIKAQNLELFGNIKKAAVLALPIAAQEIEESHLKILYFGAPARGAFFNEIVVGLKRLKNNKITLLIACGKAQHKDAFIATLKEVLPNANFTIIDCGFLEVNEISTLMSIANIGIGRAEGHLIGKSGTIIAMLEHGLPVWLPKLKNTTPITHFTFRPAYIFGDINKAVDSNLSKEYKERIQEISIQFINQLEQIQ